MTIESRGGSLLGICGRCALVPFKIALDRIEYAVYELCRFEGGEAASYFEGFVYDDRLGSVGFVQKLVYCESEDVSIDYCHSLDAPVLSASHDQIVDVLQMSDGAPRQVVRKIAGNISHIVAERLPVVAGQLFDTRSRDIVLKEHL